MRRKETARTLAASSPGGWICVYEEVQPRGLGEPARLAGPSFDGVPTPDSRATKFAKRLREPSGTGEYVDSLRGDVQTPRDVGRDYELRMGINPHRNSLTAGLIWINTRLRDATREQRIDTPERRAQRVE